MTAPTRVVSADGRIALEQVGLERGRAIVDGDLTGLAPLQAGQGWPHADTLTGLGASLESATSDADTPFVVVLLATDEVIGDCGWTGGPGPDGRAEIGYGLAASARGRGLGTEVVRSMTGWALTQSGCSTVVAEVLADNLPSRRALERVGYALDHVDDPYVWYAYPPA